MMVVVAMVVWWCWQWWTLTTRRRQKKKKKQQKLTQQKPAQTRRRPWPPIFFSFSLSLHSRSTCGTIAAAAVGLARYDDMCTRLMSEGLSPSLSLSGEGLPFFKNNFHENRPSFAFLRVV